jgi:hypothetical protein
MAQHHYMNVLQQAIIHGVDAASWTRSGPENAAEVRHENPPELTPQPDDYFGWRNPTVNLV